MKRKINKKRRKAKLYSANIHKMDRKIKKNIE